MPAFPTSTTVLDSILFRDAFGTPAMREVFSDFSLISRYAEVEIALAKAEARCGVIPAEAADEIAKRTDVSALDFDLLRQETDIVGYPILPLVHQMVKQCGDAGRYVHWGATTQDIMDTAVVLQVRAGLEIIEADIAALRGILADLVEALSRHADGGPHPSAAGAAGDVRLQDRDLAGDVRPPRRAARAIEAARAGRPVRRRRRHAGFARRQGLRGSEGAVRGTRPRRARLHLACRARRAGGSDQFSRRWSPARSARSRSTS